MADIINEELKTRQTLSTGINILDKKINGIHNGEVILYAGRPDMGRHSLALKCAYQNALFFQQQNSKKNVLFFNNFMSARNDLVEMLLEQHLEAISSIDFNKMYFTINHIEKLPLYFYRSIGTIDNLSKIIHQFVASSINIGLIIIEEWLLIQADPHSYNKELVASKIKEISSDLNIPIILTSCLCCEVEYRADKRPVLNDISSYGNALIFIDKIIFLYRDIYYLKQKIKTKKFRKGTKEQYKQRLANWKKVCSEAENKCELIVAKNSFDDLGTVLCHYDPETKVIKDSEV